MLVQRVGALPITAQDARTHTRLLDAAEDGLLEGYIQTAVEHLEGHQGVAIGEQRHTVWCSAWPTRRSIWPVRQQPGVRTN